MKLPYSEATSGDKAIAEVQKILKALGCDKFGVMTDYSAGTMIVQFEWNGKMVMFPASIKGYAAMWVKQNPWSRFKKVDRDGWNQKAMNIAEFAVCSILRDWIKAQVMAIETGLVKFEEVFFAHMQVKNGKRMIDFLRDETALLGNSNE